MSYFFKLKMVLGAAWSGRLPVTQYNQEGSNPFKTALVLVIFFINYKWDLSSFGLERLPCKQEAASSKLAGSTKREWLTTKQQCLVNDVGSLNIISFLRMKGGASHL